jgi:ketosteroid isomerase-like protein
MNPSANPAEQAIRAARQAQNEAIARADFDAVARHWTADVTIRRALGHAVDGAEDARRVLEQAAQRRPALVYARQPAVVQVSGHWPLAYEEGTWSACLATDRLRPIQSGRYAAQWVCRDGRWLIRSEVFVALEGAGPGLEVPALP